MIIPLEWMPPLMFAGLVVFMIIGYPVAFSLAAVGFFFGFLSIEMGYFTMAFMQAIPGRVFGSILSFDRRALSLPAPRSDSRSSQLKRPTTSSELTLNCQPLRMRDMPTATFSMVWSAKVSSPARRLTISGNR